MEVLGLRLSTSSAINSALMTHDIANDAVNQRLERYQRFGVHLGLERSQRLLAALGNPENRVPIVHVAGTNGKGSVCAYVTSILMEAGYRVGRYTSPHLVSWCERICVDGHEISPFDLEQTLSQTEAAISSEEETPTQFEVLTAAAWLYFAQQSVDVAVVEVGLGGRLDATNVVDHPLVTAVVSLSREHWQRLGPTLADIASEKAGILKPRCPAIIGPMPAEAEQVVMSRAISLDCPVIRPKPARLDATGFAIYTSDDKNHLPVRYELPLPGDHQLINSAIAIAAVHTLREHGWSVSDDVMARGIAKTRWRGRLQWLQWQDPTEQVHRWLVDGAHNPAAAKVLRRYVDEISHPAPTSDPSHGHRLGQPATLISGATTWLMGMLATKDHADVFRELLKPGDFLHVVPVPNHASLAPSALSDIALSVCPELSSCTPHETLHTGLQAAILDQTSLRVLCGSLYLVGHFFNTQSIRE